MGTSSDLPRGKKAWLSLPSLIRRSSGADDHQVQARINADEMARSAEEAVRVRKAAAWQWHTRGLGETVAPGKRPPPVLNLPADSVVRDKSGGGVDGTSSKEGKPIATNNSSNSLLQMKPQMEPPRLLAAESPRAALRFKAEACATTFSGKPPTPSTPSAPPASTTPLYDEFELSGLRTQMVDFVQHLQHQQPKTNEQSNPPVRDQLKSKPLPTTECDGHPNFPADTASVTSDHQKSKAAALVAAATSNYHLPRNAAAAAVVSKVPSHLRPFSALHTLFRKAISVSTTKSAKNTSPAVHEPEVLSEEDDADDAQYHYHHYIHHHHHHYHFNQSPDERAVAIRSRRRHSDSSGIHPRISSPWEAESEEEEDEVEVSPIAAYLARRRRYSDNFAGQLPAKKAAFYEDEGMKGQFAKTASPLQSQRKGFLPSKNENEGAKGESAKAASPLEFQRQHNSERFSANKIPTRKVSQEIVQPKAGSEDEFDGGIAMKSRRHSAEMYAKEACLERRAEGGGKSGGGTYKLGRAASGYTMQTRPLVNRRHSESAQSVGYEMQKGTSSPGRSPSARYYEDMLERRIGVAAASKATPARRPRHALPPLYPQ